DPVPRSAPVARCAALARVVKSNRGRCITYLPSPNPVAPREPGRGENRVPSISLSKLQPGPEADVACAAAVAARAGDSHEAAAGHAALRIRPLRLVEDAEPLDPELQADAIRQREAAEQRQVVVGESRPAELVASGRAVARLGDVGPGARIVER